MQNVNSLVKTQSKLLLALSLCATSYSNPASAWTVSDLIPWKKKKTEISSVVSANVVDRNDFFVGKKLNQSLVAAYRQEVETRKAQFIQNLVNQELQKKGTVETEVKTLVLQEDDVKAFDILLNHISQLETKTGLLADEDYLEAQAVAQKVIDLSFALKTIGEIPMILRLKTFAQGVMHEWKLDLNTPIEREATNLWNEKAGKYYTHDDLRQLKKQGVDISKLNPPSNSGIWRSPGEISQIDVKQNYWGGKQLIHQGTKIVLPNGVATFDKVKKSQTTPKMTIKYKGEDGKTYKAKLKLSKDMHSDPTASALFATLGFSSDVSKYYQNFKVYLKEGNKSLSKMKEDWMTYFTGLAPFYPATNVDSFIMSQGSQEVNKDEGGEYVIFKEVVVEADPEGLLRVGSVDFAKNGLQKLRESRAYELMNLWIENSDWDPDNTKLVLRSVGNDQYDFHYLVHDLGCSFGRLLCEKLDAYSGNVIKSVGKKQIVFDYRSPDNQPMKDESTLADYRWGARLIAQLTRKQIEDAVEVGAWPAAMQKLLVEKLIKRRNDFVKAFGLEGEALANGQVIAEIPVNDKLTTDDKAVVKGEIKKSQFPGYDQDFGNYEDSLIWKPVRDSMIKNFKNWAQMGLCSLERISANPAWLGLDDGIVAEGVFTPCREVIKNPNPTDETDVWLVRDSLRVGIRGGFGLGLSADFALVKKFTLVYGARNEEEAHNAGTHIINLVMVSDIKKGNLPKKYVLIREDYKIPRVRLRTDAKEGFIIGGEVSESEVMLNRTVINKRDDDKVIFYEDKSVYNELGAKLFFDLGLTRLGFWNMTMANNGKVDGKAWVLKPSKMTSDLFALQTVSDVIRKGDFKNIDKIEGAEPTTINATLINANVWTLSLLGFYQNQRKERDDIFRIDSLDDKKDAEFFKHETQRNNGWSVFGVAENDFVRLRGFLPSKGQNASQPIVTLEFLISDTDTKSKELDNGYIKFLNSIAPTMKPLSFVADLASSNGRWGSTETHVTLQFYPQAIKQLLTMDPEVLVRAFARNAGKDERLVLSAWREYYAENSPYKTGDADRSSQLISLPSNLEKGLNQLELMVQSLSAAKTMASQQESLRLVLKGLREAIYYDKNGESLDGSILGAITSVVGEQNIYLTRKIITPFNIENRFPGGKGLQWQTVGTFQDYGVVKMVVLPDDILEVWQMFEWLK